MARSPSMVSLQIVTCDGYNPEFFIFPAALTENNEIKLNRVAGPFSDPPF